MVLIDDAVIIDTSLLTLGIYQSKLFHNSAKVCVCVCRVVRNSNYGWRALRLLSRRSPHFFQPTNQQFKSLEDYLENMVIKLAKELPVSHTFYFSTHVIFYIVCVFVYSFIFVTEGPPF